MHTTKKEMDWAHPGRRLTTKNSFRKKMMLYWIVTVVLLYMKILKVRPSSERSGNFDQMYLNRTEADNRIKNQQTEKPV